jgi:hypothetical protein
MTELELFLKTAAPGRIPLGPMPLADRQIVRGAVRGTVPSTAVPAHLQDQVNAANANKSMAVARRNTRALGGGRADAQAYYGGVRDAHAASVAARPALPADYDAGAASASANYAVANPWLKHAPLAGAVAGGIGGALTGTGYDENGNEKSMLQRGAAGAAMGLAGGMAVQHGLPQVGGFSATH